MTTSPPALRNTFRRLRRAGPEIVLALVVLLGGLSVWQAWTIAGHLRDDARETSRVFGRIIAAENDPDPAAGAEALFQVIADIRGTGIPVVMTDSLGVPTAFANLPFGEVPFDDPRIAAYAQALDLKNLPISGPRSSHIHFGPIPVARHLTWLALLQIGLLATTIALGLWAYRIAANRNRDRLWVAMARESAHQLGTPLMSARAWIDRLNDDDPGTRNVALHLTADLERLERVAQRFERIGRPARAERVALGALAERVSQYFAPRLPQHDKRVTLSVRAPAAGPLIRGDPVLLEWALEALVRNAIDALSGRGGTITIEVTSGSGTATVTVADDGPGIPLEIRSTLFEPGISTKPGGWGIGLALARRIVEEVHGGHLEFVPVATGAVFRAELPEEQGG
ncbi:MAG: HAMP domain-containing histidine kinase [Gemmatimonadetes bacterium]|nr:HAMP domain-containing histidine kinase [Gemmatimonadota bacterium]